ncbi:GlsB/YeaQ/YmgE family stress response membrane protein [Lentilitoribacter sp. EG35]|uniref:GlsB/YeaQ/YmgE family stress response membrane protein n=1 Tax=Lentilitoribacter sp. EG35 TaxID=3234192 RepID=UPI0034602360
MDTQSLIIFLAVGVAAGFLASFIVGGGGLIRYLITGVIGAFVGGFLFSAFGINLGIDSLLIASIIQATVGAIVVVFVARMIA